MKPSKRITTNNGQTKVTLIGKWFFMSAEEIEHDYNTRLEQGDSLVTHINNVLCEVNDSINSRYKDGR